MKNYSKKISISKDIVTITVPEKSLSSIRSGDFFEIPLPARRTGMYDFSSLQLLCGLDRTSEETEFVLQEDLSRGVQFAISFISTAEVAKQNGLKLKIFKI